MTDPYAWFDPSDEDTVEFGAPETLTAMTQEQIKEAKARRKSRHARGEDDKVIRKGKNLSGNTPFRRKIYTVTSLASEEAIKAAPMQVQLILKYMTESKIRGTGAEIVSGAIAHGKLATKIESAVLFAYYRRLLERLGVEHVG